MALHHKTPWITEYHSMSKMHNIYTIKPTVTYTDLLLGTATTDIHAYTLNFQYSAQKWNMSLAVDLMFLLSQRSHVCLFF